MASQVLKWAVPQLIACWDDERMDVDRTLTRIIYGVFHHPALRDEAHDHAEEGRRLMFGVVQQWWEGQDEGTRRALRDQLSRDGVEHGKNHKEGVHDSGHGCGKPLGMPNHQTAASSGVLGGRPPASGLADHVGQMAEETAGGGVLGGLVGSLVGGVGASLLGNVVGQDDEKKRYGKQGYGPDGSYAQTEIETGHHKKKHGNDQEYYAQAESSTTAYPGGDGRQEYRRYEQPTSQSVPGGVATSRRRRHVPATEVDMNGPRTLVVYAPGPNGRRKSVRRVASRNDTNPEAGEFLMYVGGHRRRFL